MRKHGAFLFNETSDSENPEGSNLVKLREECPSKQCQESCLHERRTLFEWAFGDSRPTKEAKLLEWASRSLFYSLTK